MVGLVLGVTEIGEKPGLDAMHEPVRFGETGKRRVRYPGDEGWFRGLAGNHAACACGRPGSDLIRRRSGRCFGGHSLLLALGDTTHDGFFGPKSRRTLWFTGRFSSIECNDAWKHWLGRVTGQDHGIERYRDYLTRTWNAWSCPVPHLASGGHGWWNAKAPDLPCPQG